MSGIRHNGILDLAMADGYADLMAQPRAMGRGMGIANGMAVATRNPADFEPFATPAAA